MRLIGKLIITVTAIISLPLPAQALMVTDGDFSAWAYDSTGTATASTEMSGGNPGARVNITTVSGPTVYGTAIKSDFSTMSVLEGSTFNFQIDVLSGPGSRGEGQRLQLLVAQNSNIYANNMDITGYPNNWDTFMFSGLLQESNFTLWLGSGAVTPDFSGAVDTFFGFAAGNTISGTLTQYYDNFSLEIIPASVPEPATLALMAFGLVGLSFMRRSRQD